MSITESPRAAERFEIDLDHHSPEFRDELPRIVAELHAADGPGLVWSTAYGGFWAVYGYQAVYDAVHDHELFSSTHGPRKGVPENQVPDPYIPIDLDPPAALDYRRLVLPVFSPGAAKKSEEKIRRLATELIDEFIESGEADLVGQLTTPLPARVILQILGWDESRWPEWIEWIHAVVHDRVRHPEKAAEAVANIYGNIAAEIAARRERPTDDLMSHLMTSPVNGEVMNDTQLTGYAFLLLLGGMDTTSGLTGNSLLELDRQPELRAQLLADLDLIPEAGEEFLRHSSPSMGLYRHVTRDEVFHGQQLRKGDRAVLWYPFAGRDPAMFDDPETIRFDRGGNKHMAFGAGVHRCLGSNYARVMFRVMMQEILTRLPDYRVVGDVERFEDAGDVHAVRRLPVRFTPGKRLLAR